MTKEITKPEQIERLARLAYLLDQTKQVTNLFNSKKKKSEAARIFISGFSCSRKPDPIIYYAFMRPDVVNEIANSIREVMMSSGISDNELAAGIDEIINNLNK